jgi:hypothetical protein
LRGTRLQELAGCTLPLDDFAGRRRQQRDLGGGWIVHKIFRTCDADNLDRLCTGVEIGLRLRARRFGLFEVGLRDGAVRVEILRSFVELVGQL